MEVLKTVGGCYDQLWMDHSAKGHKWCMVVEYLIGGVWMDFIIGVVLSCSHLC